MLLILLYLKETNKNLANFLNCYNKKKTAQEKLRQEI